MVVKRETDLPKARRIHIATSVLSSGIVVASLQDLMDALTAYAEAVGYPLESPIFFPEAGDRCMLSGIDLRVRMGMFEEEPTPVEPAIFDSTVLRMTPSTLHCWDR